MGNHNFKRLVSILMESPLYQTLSVKERQSLLTTLGENYPALVSIAGEEVYLGYESSWNGIIQDR